MAYMCRRLTLTLTNHFHTLDPPLCCDSHVSPLGCVYYALVDILTFSTGLQSSSFLSLSVALCMKYKHPLGLPRAAQNHGNIAFVSTDASHSPYI